MNQEALLISIGGIITQCAVAKEYYDSKGVSDEPIQAIYAAANTARLLIEATLPDAVPDGQCPHPANQVQKISTGGGYAIVCAACDEIIEQG